MGFLSVSTALAVAAAGPVSETPTLSILAAVSVVKIAANTDPVIAEIAPHLDPALAHAKLRQPVIAFQAPVQFVASTRPVTFTTATPGRARDVAKTAAHPSSYTPRILLMGSDYMGSRPHERGIARWGSKVVLRMTSAGTSVGVNGGVAGALIRLAALND